MHRGENVDDKSGCSLTAVILKYFAFPVQVPV